MKLSNFSPLSFQNEIMKRTSKSLASLEESKQLKAPKSPVGKATYREALIENKMINDGNFLLSLGKRFLTEGTQDYKTYYKVITECIDLFNKIHMEVDIQPKLVSPALNYDKTIMESTKLEIYKGHFLDALTKKFSQPLLEGKLYSIYEKETKLLLENVAMSDTVDIENLDVEAFTKYALFESSLYDTLRDIIIPEFSRKEIDTFIGAQSPDYFEMFQENAQTLYTNLDNSIRKLAIAIGPNMFNESIGIDGLNGLGKAKPEVHEVLEEGIELKDLEKDEIGAADNVGPIGAGKITDSEVTDQLNVTFEPDVTINDDGMGMANDAINGRDAETIDNPNEDQNVLNALETEDIINTSTNEPQGGTTPDVEIGKEYNPADKLPEESNSTITIDEALNAESEVAGSPDAEAIDFADSVTQLVDTEGQPEEYISIPASMSVVEEAVHLSEPVEIQELQESFSFRQFAGASYIFKN